MRGQAPPWLALGYFPPRAAATRRLQDAAGMLASMGVTLDLGEKKQDGGGLLNDLAALEARIKALEEKLAEVGSRNAGHDLDDAA
jgi:hypothetical protein